MMQISAPDSAKSVLYSSFDSAPAVYHLRFELSLVLAKSKT